MIKDDLTNDFKQAMKENNTIKKNTIQLLRAAILLEEKNKGQGLTTEEMENIIIKEKKKRQDALGQYEKAKRQDLIEQTNKELACISKYLPEQVSEYELETYIKQIVNETQATSKDMGKIIQNVKNKYGNHAEARVISSIVKKALEVE